MEEIKQLKAMRDDAFIRLQSIPDYKLLTSLDNIIIELEGVSTIAELAQTNIEKHTKPKTVSTPVKFEKKVSQSLDEAFDKLNTTNKSNGAGNSVMDLTDEINGGVTLS